MKNTKRYIILFICFVIWIVLLVYFSNKGNLGEQKKISQYVIIDQYHYWKYRNGNWINIDSDSDYVTVDDEINWKDYDVYVNNQYYGTFDYVFRDYQEFYFDSSLKSYEITQDKLLLNHDSFLELKKFNTESFSDEDVEIVNSFMDKYNYSVNDVSVRDKYVIDEDNVVYVLSNYNEYKGNDVFYFVFYRTNNKNYLLVNERNATGIIYYELYSVIDIKNNYDNIILAYGCRDSVCYDMYEYKKRKYIKVIGD